MLEQILMHLNNWFIVPGGVHTDTYTIKDGSITLPFLVPGQYFRVCNSVFNDGLHKYPAEGLTDETFDGAIWALAVPKQLATLADEVAGWVEKNPPSPYTSESFGGYSYSRASGANGQPLTWQDAFQVQLNPYRKIREQSFVVGQQPPKPYYRPWNPEHPFGGGSR